MTNSEQAIREIAEKHFPCVGTRNDREYRKMEQDALVSSITALISEHYVSKDEHEKMKHNLTHCGSCGDPLSRDCSGCKHLWES